MENYHLVSQWASSLKTDKAFKELQDFNLKYTWAKLSETTDFVSKMHEDLPRILHIIQLQEKQNAALRAANERHREYIRVSGLADECIINDIKEKFNIDI